MNDTFIGYNSFTHLISRYTTSQPYRVTKNNQEKTRISMPFYEFTY